MDVIQARRVRFVPFALECTPLVEDEDGSIMLLGTSYPSGNRTVSTLALVGRVALHLRSSVNSRVSSPPHHTIFVTCTLPVAT